MESAQAEIIRTPLTLLELAGWSDYELLDSGHGHKLERYGPVRMVRPEPQALWRPRLAANEWSAADAVFTGNTDEEGIGRWQFRQAIPERWEMTYGAARYVCRFTSFRHVGVFPEQAAHWAWMIDRIEAGRVAGRIPKVLNLFGYTGVASLLAAAAGAEVTHIDASRKAISWARENQDMSGLPDAPIRWIVEDAVKFTDRELRRGNLYDGVLLDPPKYGRGPKGEIWHLFEALPALVASVERVLKPDASFAVLTAYSIRASFLALEEVMREAFQDRLGDGKGMLEVGELVLRERPLEDRPSRRLSTSLYCRWSSDHD